MRRGYLDWLRGVGVLIMVEAHTLDSWTRPADRGLPVYKWAIVVGGFGAPIFLFLAGAALSLAAGARLRRGATPRHVAAQALKRGLQIFALAFLFRLQAMIVSGGSLPQLLKVDILNIMGLSMMGAALLWTLGGRPLWRAVGLAAAAIAVAMLTPIVRITPALDALPDLLEWYLRPAAGRTTFTLFPWAGFLLAGAAAGVWLDAAGDPRSERRANVALGVLGCLVAAAGYAASYLPPLYPRTDFWTSSPTFFFVRLGILVAAVPLAYAWAAAWPGRSPLREFGLASLFVYWIHVEMVYGILSLPLHRRLPFGWAVAAFILFTALLFWLVRARERYLGRTK